MPMKPMRVAAVVATAMAALWVAGATREVPPQTKAPSVVVLVTVDTLRADSVSFAGHRPITSAFMDGLARDGVIFSKAYATSSWTPPSMGSVITGLFPTSHGVFAGHFRANGEVEQPVLSDTITTLAEVFDRAGYVTIGVVTNPHLMTVLGFAQGFDHYFSTSVFLPAEQLNSLVYRYLEEAFGRQWRTAMKETKTFLWIHYVDPHDPYFARRPWIEEFDPAIKESPSDYPNALMLAKLKKEFPQPDAEVGSKIRPFYDSEISYWDHHFGELVMELGLDDPDVLLAFTSDHGEELGEHGEFGHSQSLYEELVHVPMVIRWPAAIEGERTVTGAVSIVDLFPTLTELAGLEVPEQVQGRSLAPTLRKGKKLKDRPAFLQLLPDKPHLLGLRSGDWKLIVPQNGIAGPMLFDLATDPGEHRNLVSEKPGVIRRLQRQLERWFESLPPAPNPETVQLTGQQLEELKALGYVE
jgi:arylsulfatase A-like enzyme